MKAACAQVRRIRSWDDCYTAFVREAVGKLVIVVMCKVSMARSTPDMETV